MSGASKRFIVISLLIIIVTGMLGAAVTSALGAVNEADVHQNSKNYQTKTCNDCHDKYSTVSGAAGGWWDAHRRHFVSVFLNFADNQGGVDAYGCAKCHQETTPPTYYEGNPSVTKPDSTNELNREVRPAVCQECHGMFRTTKHKFDGVEYDFVASRRDCVDCHNADGPGLDPEIAHGATVLESSSSIDPFAAGIWWINQRYANTKDFCTRCHGGLAWFQVEETNPGISCGYDLCHKTSPSSFLNTAVAEFLEGTTVTGSHATHFDSDKGPGITSCETCHGTGAATGNHAGHKNLTKNFAGGDTEVLSATAVCDDCHSPGGAFNGVDSTTDSIGAKDNWTAGAYDSTTTLTVGKEKWCVGCHDSAPPTINGQVAEKIGGDNTDYGFFKSGHGLDSGSQYDKDDLDDTLGNPGAAVGCADCHDLSKTHLNGADDVSFDGQRLSSTVNGTSTPTTQRICEGCHQNSLGSFSATRQVSSHGNDTAGGYTNVLEEPFTIECFTCHEPHGNNPVGGTRNLKMIKTDINGSAIVFSGTAGDDSFDESDTVDSDDICASCHITAVNNPGYPTTMHAGGNDHSILGDQRGNQCTACHQHDYKEDAVVTPDDGFMPGGGCDLCHTFPPGGTQGTYQGSQTHAVHSTTYGYACSTCHNEYPIGHNESGVTSADDWNDGIGNDFDPANVDVVFSPINPLGEITETTVSALSPRGYDRNITCANLYCHGQAGSINGKSFSTLGGTNQSGNIPTWDDGYNINAATVFDQTQLSGDCGTCHDTTADNQAQGGTFWPIWDTTNNANDWSVTTSAIAWDVTSGTSLGSTSTQVSHGTHLDKLRGPKSVCSDCHSTPPTVAGGGGPAGKHVNKVLDFKDSTTTIAATTACNTCHSPEGAYDGVNDTSQSVGAKDNWSTGVYDTTDTTNAFDAGKDKWCVGCHDTSPSTINTISAPAVDLAAYGFYSTGHGRQDLVDCLDCHDYGEEHIDGEARTYEFEDSAQTPQVFQEGYRLQKIDSDYPLVVPLRNGSDAESRGKLCWKCHNQDSIFGNEASRTTNFRISPPFEKWAGDNQGVSTQGNVHYRMNYPGEPGDDVVWNSDWDDDTDDGGGGDYGFDSFPTCITCHNVHGSSAATMIRDGSLSGKDATATGYDGFEFSYVTFDSTVAGFPPFTENPLYFATSTGATRTNSLGGVMRFVGAKSDQRACVTNGCHGTDLDLVAKNRFIVNANAGLPPGTFATQTDTTTINLLDYYRPVVPVALSAFYTSDNTVTVVFTEPVSAVAADFTNLQGSSGPLTKNSIIGSGTMIIEININSTTDATGTLDVGSGVISVANGTALTPVTSQKIWSGRD